MMAKTMQSFGRSSGLLKHQTGETVPERFEAKPGDLKLIDFGVMQPEIGAEGGMGSEAKYDGQLVEVQLIFLRILRYASG